MPLESPFPKSGFSIVDRRKNPQGKNIGNVQRVYHRLNPRIQDAIMKQGLQDSRIVGSDSNNVVLEIPTDPLHEPHFHTIFTSGQRQLVYNGNKKFSTGDRIPRAGVSGAGQQGQPGQGQEKGHGTGDGDGTDGQDKFRFVMSREDFENMFFKYMHLPFLKKAAGLTTLLETRNAGHTKEGPPSRLLRGKSFEQSFARRIGLGRPKNEQIEAETEKLNALQNNGDSDAVARQQALLDALKEKQARIPWIDPVDLRYRRTETIERPNTEAVMFCMMDVSDSMTEHRKTVAKAGFMVLGAFLNRNYKGVKFVFIQHTDKAWETDEETFLHGTRTGSTKVSPAFVLAKEIRTQRFPSSRYNCYYAYAGDGDNYEAPSITRPAITAFQKDCQHGLYMEILPDYPPQTVLMRDFLAVQEGFPRRLSMHRANQVTEVAPLFRRMYDSRQKDSLHAVLGGPTAFTRPEP